MQYATWKTRLASQCKNPHTFRHLRRAARDGWLCGCCQGPYTYKSSSGRLRRHEQVGRQRTLDGLGGAPGVGHSRDRRPGHVDAPIAGEIPILVFLSCQACPTTRLKPAQALRDRVSFQITLQSRSPSCPLSVRLVGLLPTAAHHAPLISAVEYLRVETRAMAIAVDQLTLVCLYRATGDEPSRSTQIPVCTHQGIIMLDLIQL